jgi:hypothetical protein
LRLPQDEPVADWMVEGVAIARQPATHP